MYNVIYLGCLGYNNGLCYGIYYNINFKVEMVNIIGEGGTQEELPCNDVLNTITNEKCKSEGELKLLVGRRTISTIFTIFYDFYGLTVLSNNIANTFFADTHQIVHFKGT